MVCRRRDSAGTRIARLVALVLLSVLCAVDVRPQDSGTIRLALSAQRVSEGDRFSISIEIDPVEAAMVRVDEPDYPDAIGRVGGVQVVARGGPFDAGSTVVRAEFQAVQAGRWIIEPFTIITPETIYRSEPALIEISLRDNPSLVPFELQWRVHSDTIYQGQSVAVTLDMVKVTEFTFPDQITVQSPSGALFEEAQGVGEIESVRYGDIELFRVPVASYLLTPSAAGSLTLPPAEIRAFGLTRRSAALPLTVGALPDGVGDTGAVGDFVFSSHLSNTEIGLDEAVELRMQAQGIGNRGFLQFPAVSAEGMVISDSETSEDLLPGPAGYIGTRVQTVRLRPTAAGEFRINVDPFTWYEPRTGRVRREAARSHPVRVVDRSEAAPAVERELPPPLSPDKVRRVATMDLFRLPGTYLTTMPGLIMVAVVIYVRRRRRESIALFSAVLLLGAGMLVPMPDAGRLETFVRHYEEGEYGEAFAVSLELLEQQPEHPGLLYNSGVAAFAAGKHARSIFYLRRALVMKPFFTQAAAALSRIEDELGLDRQFTRRRSVHPDVPLIASLVLFYALAVLLVIPYSRRRAGYAIAVIATLFLLAGSLSLFGYSLLVRREPVAIVGPETANLQRIPEDGAQTWLRLSAGTAVRPLVTREGYTLVRTGYGLDGWMPGDQLLSQE